LVISQTFYSFSSSTEDDDDDDVDDDVDTKEDSNDVHNPAFCEDGAPKTTVSDH